MREKIAGVFKEPETESSARTERHIQQPVIAFLFGGTAVCVMQRHRRCYKTAFYDSTILRTGLCERGGVRRL